MKMIAMVLTFAVVMGMTINHVEIKASEQTNKKQNEIEKVTWKEIREMKTEEFEKCKLENGDIRLISNKVDGSKIVTEIKKSYSTITYYDRMGEEISCEYIEYKNNTRKFDRTYDKFGRKYFYHDIYNESLTIGCKAIYEINLTSLTAQQLLEIDKYKTAIDNINSAMDKAAKSAGIALVILGPIAVFALALYAEGMATAAIVAACKTEFPILMGIGDVVVANALGHVFGIEDDREMMKEKYEVIKVWGKKVGTA